MLIPNGITHFAGSDRKRHGRHADPEMPTVHFPQEEQFRGERNSKLGELLGDCEEKTGKRRGGINFLA